MTETELGSEGLATGEVVETNLVSDSGRPADQKLETDISLPTRSRRRSVPVPPIRSLSTRQSLHQHGSADLPKDRRSCPQPPRRVSSASIARTIEKLQELLDQAESIASMLESQQAEEDTGIENGAHTRPSGIVNTQIASTTNPAEPPGHGEVPFEIPKRRIKFTEDCIPEEDSSQAGPTSVTRSDFAYVPVFHPTYKIKSTLSPPAISEEFELRPMIPRRLRRSRVVKSTERKSFTTTGPSLEKDEDPASQPDTPSRPKTQQGIVQTIARKEAPRIVLRTTSTGSRDPLEPRRRTVYSGLPPALKVIPPTPEQEAAAVSPSRRAESFENVKDEDSFAGETEPRYYAPAFRPGHERHFTQMFGVESRQLSIDFAHAPRRETTMIGLKGLRQVDLHNKPEDFDVHTSSHHAPIARNWPLSRKRFAATIACVNTACIGILIGIYAGEVPAIQYVIVDFHHYTILGNVFLYCGLVIPTLLFWPLPLLHGRKSYTVSSLAIALCLQIPQGVAVSDFRSPYVRTYRVLLLLSRAVSGFALGFCSMNSHAALLDVFGASLQSRNPHQEVVDPYDVRRHGGGMGLWLGIWSWCSIGTISIGFCIGAFIISGAPVSWGFWTGSLLLMGILLLNIIAPELRRSAFRRTIAEFQGDTGGFSRVARGEVKMHLRGTGPFWWGEEIKAGIEMSWLMVKQPGFLVLTMYAAWVYAQFTMVLMFLGALTSTYYSFRPVLVGTCVLCLGLGALIATPFQKASWLSRARYRPPRTDSMTLQTSFTWSSHLVRRALFTIVLPLAAISYTLTSKGPPFPVAVPCIFAAAVGFCSNLALAECYGLIMENFDTSDLQPGMNGRPVRNSIVDRFRSQRTNFSCYPRISAGVAVTQSLQYTIAAAATGICGRLERRYGAMLATAIVAAALLVLTAFLTVILFRGKSVRMIRYDEPTSTLAGWEPVILGQPSGTTRKISLLEAGRQTRWSEIRRRNRVDPGLTGS